MNIVCFPIRTMDKTVLGKILKGGIEKIHEAGAVLVGGHSVEDPELKYGLSVTGLVHPGKILSNAGARPGDALILTKPIGTGILATGVKAGLASAAAATKAIETMAALNEKAARIMSSYPVRACTDVTGFGLLGHALEMAAGSGVSITLFMERVPLLPEGLDLAGMGIVPAASYANLAACSDRLRGAEIIDPLLLNLFSDAQISGGLLISLPEKDASSLVADLLAHGVHAAAVIGRVENGEVGTVRLE
jgi:selenide,water dikinase